MLRAIYEKPMKLDNGNTIDIHGREWPYSEAELCPECGQPDSCGDCNHARLTDEDVKIILGE